VLFFFAVRTTRGARQRFLCRAAPHGNDVLHGNACFSRSDLPNVELENKVFLIF
jgi:hypothetical protein